MLPELDGFRLSEIAGVGVDGNVDRQDKDFQRGSEREGFQVVLDVPFAPAARKKIENKDFLAFDARWNVRGR